MCRRFPSPLLAFGSIAVTYSAAPVWAWVNSIWMANAPSTGSYGQNDTVVPVGPAGYSAYDELAYAVHAKGGLPGLGAAVSN